VKANEVVVEKIEACKIVQFFLGLLGGLD